MRVPSVGQSLASGSAGAEEQDEKVAFLKFLTIFRKHF